jgi:hypothetical protein
MFIVDPHALQLLTLQEIHDPLFKVNPVIQTMHAVELQVAQFKRLQTSQVKSFPT